MASGRTARRDGFRQTKVDTASKERVCAGVFQDSKRIRRFWNRKITPILLACQYLETLIYHRKELT